MKARIDGLQVLKGGVGKATIYIEKDDMKSALDLNEQEVIVSLSVAGEQEDMASQEQEPLFDDPLGEAEKAAERALAFIKVARLM